MKEYGISGIPVVERATGTSSINISPSAPGKLVGMLELAHCHTTGPADSR